jgi:hypothetical protein
VLVTSRRYLGDLPAAPVPMQLGTLPPEDALAMFVTLVPRAKAESGLVLEIAELCGYLPLAITLLAGLFARHRSWDMAYLIAETKGKLLRVSSENRTVAAAFELSYQYLTETQQRFFVHLGLHPGPDIDPYAAAALTGLSYDDTIRILDELHADGLLTEPLPRRYQMHNLIHQYARHTRYSSGSARPRPPLYSLNLTPSPTRNPERSRAPSWHAHLHYRVQGERDQHGHDRRHRRPCGARHRGAPRAPTVG